MFFEAESNKKKYEVQVNESRSGYKVSLREEGKDWRHFDISNDQYQYLDETVSFLFNNSSYLIDVTNLGMEYTVFTRGSYRTIKIFNEEAILHESLKAGGGFGTGENLSSGMPGKIVKVLVKSGDEVKEGEPLLIMEAMKMENEMRADRDIKIKDVNVKAGDNVEAGAVLITFAK
ncbi:MAG: biotin/lipoyl-binding protein [Bdellovibrionales bacterium]|nr:biotin/lipoyl-binding protein [Bdellovibrionales bacterium]